jgi:hypothetical protein
VIDGNGAPDAIAKQFKGTFLDTFPGIDAAWWILGILESVIFILLVVSLVTLEFGQTSGVAQIVVYAGATVALIGLVLFMPPYRSRNWISGR